MKPKTKSDSISIAEYKEILDKQKPKRNKRHEGILQEQCKNRFQWYKFYNHLLIEAIFVHIPNERIFGEALIKYLAIKKVPLSATQARLLKFYLSGFAKNLAKAGVFKGFLDNMIICEGGKVIFFEIKIGKNKPSFEQAGLMDVLKYFGFGVYLLYSIEEFEEMLEIEKIKKEFGNMNAIEERNY